MYRGVFGLDCVEDAKEEKLRFGSWSSAYIKLGAPSVWDCFNINFDEKVTSAVDTRANVLYNLIISVNQEWTSTNKIKTQELSTVYVCQPQ